MPNTWITTDGATITRPAGMSDSDWSTVLYGAGWSPGATSSAGSPGSVNPTQVLGLIDQGMQAGARFFSTLYGTINSTNPAAGTVSTSTGPTPAMPFGTARTVPAGALGNVSSTGGSGANINVDVKEDSFLDKPANVALLAGGAALVLLLVLRR